MSKSQHYQQLQYEARIAIANFQAQDLIALMRRAQAKRMPRSRGVERRGKMADMVSAHCSPPLANDRLFPGHWESGLIKGNASAVGSLVERSSRLLILVHLPGPKPGGAACPATARTNSMRLLKKLTTARVKL